MSVPTEREVSYIYLSRGEFKSVRDDLRYCYIKDGLSAMHYAVNNGDLEKVQQLQEMYQEEKLFTINCAIIGLPALVNAVLYNHPDILQYLLENCGGDPNYGETIKPLDMACTESRLDCLSILLNYGADPEKMRDPKLFEKPEIQEYLSNVSKMTKSASKV